MTDLDAQQVETRSIWESIPGSGKLREIYGYYPTLHDANVVDLRIEFETKSLYIAFEYCDLVQKPGEPEESECRLIGIRWTNVEKSALTLDGNEIYHVDFIQVGNMIETKFASCFGSFGSILSQEIEVALVTESKREQRSEEDRYLHVIKLQLVG
jgi:hypothetical protein